jgi:hypothetical protein
MNGTTISPRATVTQTQERALVRLYDARGGLLYESESYPQDNAHAMVTLLLWLFAPEAARYELVMAEEEGR